MRNAGMALRRDVELSAVRKQRDFRRCDDSHAAVFEGHGKLWPEEQCRLPWQVFRHCSEFHLHTLCSHFFSRLIRWAAPEPVKNSIFINSQSIACSTIESSFPRPTPSILTSPRQCLRTSTSSDGQNNMAAASTTKNANANAKPARATSPRRKPKTSAACGPKCTPRRGERRRSK